MGLEQIVNLNISRDTASVSQAGFGTPLILGSNAGFANPTVRSYSSLPGVLADFATSTDEYKAAAKCFGQTPKPATVKIAKMLAKVAQVNTLTPDVSLQQIAHFIVTIDGVAFDFTSDADPTAAEIVTGLKDLVNAASACKMAATGTTTLVLTAKSAGVSSSVSCSANLANVLTTPNVGVAESLAAIALSGDDDWYALICTSKADGDILEAAAYIEAVKKIYGVSKNGASILDQADRTDVFSKLMDGNYFRTFCFFSNDYANFPEAGLLGRVLPLIPGSETWAFKTIAGITVDSLTASSIAALKSKNANYYIKMGGNSIVLDGKVAGGEWIDIIRLIDLIAARMQENIFGSLLRNAKIPMTNGGVTVIENDVSSVLSANQKTGGIAPDEVDASGDLVPGFSTSFPKVSEISTNDRAARKLTGGKFSARMAGAIHAAEINGNVTV